MSTDPGQSLSKRSTATRLINRAQERCHVARSRFLEAWQLGHDEIPWPVHHEFQSAVLEYYEALRRMRDNPQVSEFWTDAELAEQLVGRKPVVDDHTGKVVIEPQYESITGLDNIYQVVSPGGAIEREVNDVFGRRTVVESTNRFADGETLLHISHVLDDAAAMLGFEPDSASEIDDGSATAY